MDIILSIKERLNPSLKCERIGHNYHHQKFYIWKRDEGIKNLRVRNIPVTCNRCGHVLDRGKVAHRTYYVSIQLPDNLWHEIDSNNVIIMETAYMNDNQHGATK